MPNGIYPNPRLRPQANGTAGLRIRTWWQRQRLDEELARGTDPASDPALALRSRQLAGQAERLRLADALDAVVHDPRSPSFSVQLQPRRLQLRECAGDVLALVSRLRDGHPIDVQGVAMVSLLLTDGASPLYYAGAPCSLRHTVRSARHALDPIAAAPAVREAA